MGGNVNSLAVYNGKLIAAGSGNNTSYPNGPNLLELLNDTVWESIGQTTGTGRWNTSNLCVNNGKLYFTYINYMASWNGSSFNIIDSCRDGLLAPYWTLFNYNGNLYASAGMDGCYFFILPDSIHTYIALWNGSRWYMVKDSLAGSPHFAVFVRSSAVNNGVLYMDVNDEKGTESFLSFDGNSFKILSPKLNVNNGTLMAYNGNIYGSNGYFTKWNGSSFDIIQADSIIITKSQFELLGVFNGYLYAEIATGLGRWDGKSWTSFGNGLMANCIAEYNGNLYFGTSSGVYELTNDSSWIGFYNHIDNTDYAPLATPKNLGSNYTSSSQPQVIKICADGSKATEIKYTIKDSSIKNIRFRVQSNDNNLDTVLNGTFNTSNYTYSIDGDTVIARFTHPQYLQGGGISRSDTIEVFDISTGIVLYKHPIAIYRAPVLMVHGIWSDMSCFEDMEKSICAVMYPPNSTLTLRADYKPSNSEDYFSNRGVVPDNINKLLSSARNLNFSAGKVIVIGHSMGGVLTRDYLQSDFYHYRNDIQSIITVNTPHSGTQSANFILKSPHIMISMGILGKNCKNGAVNDLAANSSENSILNGPNLNYNIVPSNTISTVTTSNLNWSGALMAMGAASERMSVTAFKKILYNSETNDLIVPLSSQQASKTPDSPINNQQHVESPANLNVIAKVETLLQNSPNNPTYFMQNGFHPDTLKSVYKRDPFGNGEYVSASTGKVTIHALVNSHYYPEDTIPIIVSSTGDINHLIICAGNPIIDLSFLDTLTGSATYKYPVPINVVGNIKIMAVGYDDSGYVDLDTIITLVVTKANLDSIKVYPQSLYLNRGQTSNIELTGYFNHGTSVNLSYLDSIQYIVSDTSVATHLSLNSFKGMKADTTFVTATYRNKSLQFPVYVFPASQSLGINDHNPNISPISELGNISIYPNPFNQTATIEFELIESRNVTITVYDIFGKQVAELMNAKQTIGKHQIILNGNSLSEGLYIIKISTDNQIVNRKLLFMRQN